MEGMTIKQLADAQGVSKTAIRNYMDAEFRAKYTAKNEKGVITITPNGCKVIAENLAKQPETERKDFSETELLTIPRSVWKLMEDQIREKDEQLKVKDQQIADLASTVRAQAESLHAEQALHAGTMQKQLTAEPRKWAWPWKKGE